MLRVMTGQNEIDERLLRYLLGEMTREERREVEEWVARSEENAAYFRRFQRLHLRVSWGMRSELVTTSFGALRRRLTRGRRMWTRAGVAAAVALLLGVGGLLVWEREALPEPSVREVAIVPGRARAVLHLSSGETVAMDTLARELTERDGTAIRVDEDGRVAYEAAGGGETERAPMNRIEVPRGGEFHVTLADGSEVWLNADSELRYPARFTGADRRVWLKGEAYFSVRTDSARPFVVEAEDVRVRVYGTEFNVSTQETGRVETVLVSGSVGMGHGGEEVALRPGEKGTFARESGEMTVEEVAMPTGGARAVAVGSSVTREGRTYRLEGEGRVEKGNAGATFSLDGQVHGRRLEVEVTVPVVPMLVEPRVVFEGRREQRGE